MTDSFISRACVHAWPCVCMCVCSCSCVPPYRFSLQPLSTSNLLDIMSQLVACCTSDKCDYVAVVCVCEGH